MLGLKLNHVSKRGHRWERIARHHTSYLWEVLPSIYKQKGWSYCLPSYIEASHNACLHTKCFLFGDMIVNISVWSVVIFFNSALRVLFYSFYCTTMILSCYNIVLLTFVLHVLLQKKCYTFLEYQFWWFVLWFNCNVCWEISQMKFNISVRPLLVYIKFRNKTILIICLPGVLFETV